MAEEIDESGFYREDFSTESDWEVFNAQLGEIFQNWDLANANWGRVYAKNELFSCEWQVQTEKLELLKKDISVTYYASQLEAQQEPEQQHPNAEKLQLHLDLMSLQNTFGPPMIAPVNNELHTLARLYGLRRFVVMQPSKQSLFLKNPSEFTFFLSAANVVAAELCCTVPIFVQLFDPKWNYFDGVHVSQSLRTNFDLIGLETAPTTCRHLTGLLTMFKEKLPVTYTRPAVISVRNTYAMDTEKLRIPMRVPFHFGANDDGIDDEVTKVIGTHFITLPYGYFPDSCTEVYAVYTWPEIAENMVIDSELRSDFVPSKAPFGRVHQLVHANAYLSNCLADYLKLATNTDAIAVDRKLPTHKMPAGPMNGNELKEMLNYLFGVDLFPYWNRDVQNKKFNSLRIKSAHVDSLVFRLSSLLATCNAHFGGTNGMAQLWAAFVRQLRERFDNCEKIQGAGSGFPDTRYCLLHQKFQLLNVCMQRRKLRESGTSSNVIVISSDEDEDDEFYDCGEDTEQHILLKIAELQLIPEGRQKRLGRLKLLDSDEPLYVPVTQEPVPKTEDQLHDDAELMLKLGPGSDLTTQMMCSSLLSDMEAFKAANPKASFEDFIRWYSPKDWEEKTVELKQEAVEVRQEAIELNKGAAADNGSPSRPVEVKKETAVVGDGSPSRPSGQLSARMVAPGNTWQTVWKQAHPIPVSRQRRLFDDTSEALKVMHYLETRSIAEIYELTLVPLLHYAMLSLQEIYESSDVCDLFAPQFDEISAALCHLSRDIDIIGHNEVGNIPTLEPLVQKFKTLEQLFYQYKCFERMCGYPSRPYTSRADVKTQFREILANGGSYNVVSTKQQSTKQQPAATTAGEGDVGDGSDSGGSIMLNPSFKQDMRDSLISKEYVIRIDGDTVSTSNGQAGPQFLRAIITGEKLRLCGAFSENTTFV